MFRIPVTAFLVAVGALLVPGAVSAQVATFASFQVAGRGPGLNYFWTNNGPASGSMNCVFQANFTAFGQYLSDAIANTGGAFPGSGIVPATVVVSIATTTFASSGGGSVTQPLTTIGGMTIVANTPIGGQNNLLSMNFTGTLVGGVEGNVVTMSGSTPLDTVTFSSAFVTFSATTTRNFSMQGTSVLPAISILNNFMSSWTTDFSTTTFGGDLAGIPEPSSIAMLGLVGVGGAYIYRRRSKKAKALAAAEAAKEQTAKTTALQPSAV